MAYRRLKRNEKPARVLDLRDCSGDSLALGPCQMCRSPGWGDCKGHNTQSGPPIHCLRWSQEIGASAISPGLPTAPRSQVPAYPCLPILIISVVHTAIFLPLAPPLTALAHLLLLSLSLTFHLSWLKRLCTLLTFPEHTAAWNTLSGSYMRWSYLSGVAHLHVRHFFHSLLFPGPSQKPNGVWGFFSEMKIFFTLENKDITTSLPSLFFTSFWTRC